MKSKKALDTLATVNLEQGSNHEVMTQDNLATIHENAEIIQQSRTNSQNQMEEEK